MDRKLTDTELAIIDREANRRMAEADLCIKGWAKEAMEDSRLFLIGSGDDFCATVQRRYVWGVVSYDARLDSLIGVFEANLRKRAVNPDLDYENEKGGKARPVLDAAAHYEAVAWNEVADFIAGLAEGGGKEPA
ncbi:hypothetical protein BB934_45320 (plasmid) [Microvirga ossetica]|uniref:Uncharacterized protein n=1 Tax=Microvirga ossetica TaxID=1882682 RepID=A0A1B2EZT8_9HYPH|nr:hypothetical protein [Microvirga ossetica]ANY85442.1 hypothetical protein BB934_45320 [Microvirga ossetica]